MSKEYTWCATQLITFGQYRKPEVHNVLQVPLEIDWVKAAGNMLKNLSKFGRAVSEIVSGKTKQPDSQTNSSQCSAPLPGMK